MATNVAATRQTTAAARQLAGVHRLFGSRHEIEARALVMVLVGQHHLHIVAEQLGESRVGDELLQTEATRRHLDLVRMDLVEVHRHRVDVHKHAAPNALQIVAGARPRVDDRKVEQAERPHLAFFHRLVRLRRRPQHPLAGTRVRRRMPSVEVANEMDNFELAI